MRSFFFLIMVTLLLLTSDTQDTQALEVLSKQGISEEVFELTCVADYKQVGTYVDPDKKQYDLTFKNTGTFPVELCIKFRYRNKRDHLKNKHYMHHIVNQGEELKLSRLYFEPCKGTVYVHIRMTSLCKETGRRFLSSYKAGAEATLTLTEIKK